MGKKNRLQDQSYNERLERSLTHWPPENLVQGIPDARTLGRLVDPRGVVWAFRRPLTESGARKLAVTADEMIVDNGVGNVFVAESERLSIWASVEKDGHLPGEDPTPYLEYTPYEFDSEGGLAMLYLRRSC